MDNFALGGTGASKYGRDDHTFIITYIVAEMDGKLTFTNSTHRMEEVSLLLTYTSASLERYETWLLRSNLPFSL